MPHAQHRRGLSLADKYPPSPACTCPVCLAYCARPGWWSVAEAGLALAAGYGRRMMLEMAPDYSFGVLSPAFKGCEVDFASNRYAAHGCTFFHDQRCELHGTGLMPLECRFCHHDRPGLGPKCHAAIEQDWNTPAGASLVVRWSRKTGFLERIQRYWLLTCKK
jgi:hypothetical protein